MASLARPLQLDGPLGERFWSKVDLSAGPDGCWLWTAGLGKGGYGSYAWTPEMGVHWHVPAHRLALVEATGSDVPGELTVDHLCRVRRCVNPAHLEAVTVQENCARGDQRENNGNALKTHCLRGHDLLDPTNMRVTTGRRRCRSCEALHRERKRAKAVARG